MNTPRHRPLSIGPLRAFEAVARRSSFRAAAEELHLTQPAISRQIQGLEDELGAALFLRGTRHVELTRAGDTLLRAVQSTLDRLDDAVRQIRNEQGRRQISVTTFASFASLWLLPRLQEFQRQQPGVDLRISAVDTMVDADDPELDFGLRHCLPDAVPPGSTMLFPEVLTPVCSPALAKKLKRVEDLAHHTLLENSDRAPSRGPLGWRHWLGEHKLSRLEPQGWIYLNYTQQQIQAALAGQGVALARTAMIADILERGELVEPFGVAGRRASPYAYWLVCWPRSARAEAQAFEEWLLAQAAKTRVYMEGRG